MERAERASEAGERKPRTRDRKPGREGRKTAEGEPADGVGYLSIESKPYATIFVDGRRVGVTPLIRHPVPAGEHRVRAVIESGEARTFSVEVPAGGTAPPRHLYW